MEEKNSLRNRLFCLQSFEIRKANSYHNRRALLDNLFFSDKNRCISQNEADRLFYKYTNVARSN